MAVSVILMLVSFAAILGGAVLFTNAVEWVGSRLNLGHGAVGSVLAAVATAMPESVIPVVAIISGEQSGDLAIGAILGAPFLLGTLAMAVVGVSVPIYGRRREQGSEVRPDRRTSRRDLAVFLPALSVALVVGLVGSAVVEIVAAVVLVGCYAAYVWRTVVRNRSDGDEEELGKLMFRPRSESPTTVWIAVQVAAGLALIVGGAQLFVVQVESIGHAIGVSALVLALILAPLASELPEKLNSVLWVRQGKDALALGNVTGAMVFQSTIPVAIGLLFVDWTLRGPAVVASACALAGGALCLLIIQRRGRFSAVAIGVWLTLYIGCVGFALLTE